MSVIIKLNDGRTIVVGNSLDAVKDAVEGARKSGKSIQINTPDGAVFVSPEQVVSFEALSPAQQAAAAAAATQAEPELAEAG